jgi:hypothetical protein
MNTEMNGKKIAKVFWPDTSTEQGIQLVAGSACDDLHLSATHHGDRDEFWIVQTTNGAEVARHNARYVTAIVWRLVKYKLLQDRFEHKAGTTVYAVSLPDFGMAWDDSRAFGVEHISVTVTEGKYPLFTVPVSYLEEIKE